MAGSGLARIAILIGVVLALWWLSGLGRVPADPRQIFGAEQVARAEAYSAPRYLAGTVAIVLGLAALAILAFTRLGDRVIDPLRGWPWPLAVATAAAVALTARGLARLPPTYWAGHLHERAWGFSTQSSARWLSDWLKGLGIGIVTMALVLVVLFAIIRSFPRLWPALAALAAAGFTLVLSFAGPLLFEPAFNRFHPLEDRAFAAELRELADRAGVPVRQVLVADASRRTTKENAYVSGLGATRRLVVYDTLLRQAPREEVRLVVAHELGHRRLGHLEIGSAVAALGAAGAVVLLWLLFRWGVLRGSPADPRAVPAILFVFSLLTVATLPVQNLVSRTMERAADRFAVRLTADPHGYARMMRGLATRNLSDLDPGPVAYRFVFTHPAPAERVVEASRTTGEPPGRTEDAVIG